MLKARISSLVVVGLLLSAGAVNAAESAFPGNADEGSNELAPRTTFADQYRGTLTKDGVNTAQSAIAGNADEGSSELAPRSTYADEHRPTLGDRAGSMHSDANAVSAFPVSNALD
jgi:hypothetical protein